MADEKNMLIDCGKFFGLQTAADVHFYPNALAGRDINDLFLDSLSFNFQSKIDAVREYFQRMRTKIT